MIYDIDTLFANSSVCSPTIWTKLSLNFCLYHIVPYQERWPRISEIHLFLQWIQFKLQKPRTKSTTQKFFRRHSLQLGMILNFYNLIYLTYIQLFKNFQILSKFRFMIKLNVVDSEVDIKSSFGQWL